MGPLPSQGRVAATDRGRFDTPHRVTLQNATAAAAAAEAATYRFRYMNCSGGTHSLAGALLFYLPLTPTLYQPVVKFRSAVAHIPAQSEPFRGPPLGHFPPPPCPIRRHSPCSVCHASLGSLSVSLISGPIIEKRTTYYTLA